MAYQVLARKWRPRNFPELVGQAHVVKALTNALEQARLHHAYLFTGTRGVGKTTIARILAKSLNCETKGVTAYPCGQCAACTEIDNGRFVDLIEVDAASRTRVEDTREILDNVPYAPTRGRYKVYLIDEVHMLSNSSFNALLKTLEEPPPHVKFLLATTDPQRLPATVLSRCLQFSLKRIPPDAISEHLRKILDTEQINYEVAALNQLAQAADGSVRDALSLLDQAIGYGGGQLIAADVTSMLGTLDKQVVIKLLQTLAAQDAAGLLAHIAQLAEQNPDFHSVLGEVLSVLQRLAVVQVLPESLDPNAESDTEALLTLTQQLTPEDIQLFYQIGLIGRRDLPFAPDARGGFEMVMLRMLAFRPVNSLPSSNRATPLPATSQTHSQPPLATRTAPPATSHLPPPLPDMPPQSQGVAEPPPTHLAPPPPSSASTPTLPEGIETATGSLSDEWVNMVNSVELSGVARQLALNCALKRREGNNLYLTLSPKLRSYLNRQQELEETLRTQWNAPIRLHISTDSEGEAQQTPAMHQQQQQADQQQTIEAELAEDPFINHLKQHCDARIKKVTLRASRT